VPVNHVAKDEMETRSILQIVSGFKPTVDGLGDFSRRLGDALWQQHAIRSHFLAYRRPKSPLDATEILPNTISYPAESTPSSFLAHARELIAAQHFDCVLLHYGGYSYSSNGRPGEFVKAMEELAQSTRALVFFHEVYATGMPWRRSFWTRGEQRRSAGNLFRIASTAFTSTALFESMLQPLNANHCELIQIPIFSNVGEPENLRPLGERSRRLVVFGQLVTRIRLYRTHRHTLEDICRRLRIESIVDIGSGQSADIPKTLAGIEVQSSGWMEEQQVSDLMADSIAGVIGYWPDSWQKSGVIASYLAHGLVPIVVELHNRTIPRPAFVPYISAEDLSRLSSSNGSLTDEKMQSIVDAGYEFYLRDQSVSRCAEAIARAAYPGQSPTSAGK
jgi:hypothetical protein